MINPSDTQQIAYDLRTYLGSADWTSEGISLNKEDALKILEILSNTLPRSQMLVEQGLVTSKRRGAERDALQYQLDALGRIYARTVAHVETLLKAQDE
jgi:phage terminase Nu1 subunit (DNA packaging protein)